jgi:hypothetical protein
MSVYECVRNVRGAREYRGAGRNMPHFLLVTLAVDTGSLRVHVCVCVYVWVCVPCVSARVAV